jgi:ABC-type transporter Mla subunit MlaD
MRARERTATVRNLGEIAQAQVSRAEAVAVPVRLLAAAAVLAIEATAGRGMPAPTVAAATLGVFAAWSLVLAILAARKVDRTPLSRVSVVLDAVGITAIALSLLAGSPEGLWSSELLVLEAWALCLICMAPMRLRVADAVFACAAAVFAPLAYSAVAVLRSPSTMATWIFLVPPANLAVGALAVIGTVSVRRAMAENLVTEDLMRASRRLKMTLDIVSASIYNLHQLINQLADVSRAVSEGAREQERGIERVSTTAGELASTMEGIARSTGRAADTVGRTAESSARGNAIVQRVVEEILGIHDTVDRMVAALARLNDIADQTNLLALNASIEASRAGDEHSGFSVVAAEIRTLAEKSSQTAGEVSTWVRQIETVITRGGDSSREAGTIFAAIARELGDHAGFIQELSQTVQTQLVANREVSGTVTSIDAVVVENTGSADRVADIVASLKQELEKLESLVGDKVQEVEQLTRGSPTARRVEAPPGR